MRPVETLAEYYFFKAAQAKLSAAGAADDGERAHWQELARAYRAKALRARPSINTSDPH
jgi:hypothetical protein